MSARALLAAGLLASLVAVPAAAQESQFVSDLRREGEHIADSCGSFSLKALGNCAYTLTTSYPFHVSFGSLAPGNGLAIGAALSERYTPNESWRLTFSGDAVRSFGGSYRAGGYVKFIHTPGLGVSVVTGGPTPPRPRRIKLDTWVIDLAAMTTSLETIDFYGLGPSAPEADRQSFSERQTLVSGSVILPMSGASWFGALRPAPMGGVTWRRIAAHPGNVEPSHYVQVDGGIRLRPSLPSGRLHVNYLAMAQRFTGLTESRESFSRWTLDLQHEIPIYRGAASAGRPSDVNGPNECATSLDSLECPPLTRVRDRTGSVGLRVLVVASSARPGGGIPFYLQPTLGGSNINGERMLAAFADYRFRGPNLLLLQQSIEHSLWGPVGVFAALEQGMVALHAADLGLAHLARSTSAGVTLRAGGLPAMTLAVAWGREGRHVIASVNTGLLGGGSRPSLY